jgi:predicted esterase
MLAACALFVPAVPAGARAAQTSPSPPSPAWCAPEVDELSEGVCHIDGGARAGWRTLVIFLHGAIAKDTTWQWTQERALLRQAKQSGFEAIFPRAPLTGGAYLWPGTVPKKDGVEQELIDGWFRAKKQLEEKSGRAYDEVFVMGFSSGAYFVSSLAQRARVEADGYAVYAGAGVVWAPGIDARLQPPVFIGVCGEDERTAPDSRSFGASLAARGWAHRVDERKIGHMFGDVHVAHAVAYLRAAALKARGK